MPFPILTSLIVLPIVGAILLFFVKEDEQHRTMLLTGALVVTVLVFLETLLLWARFDPASATELHAQAYRGSLVAVYSPPMPEN